MSDNKLRRLASADMVMAALGYRQQAPSDGFGTITTPLQELDPDYEAVAYARRFIAEEDTDQYWAGCTHFEFNRAAVWALEAFRLMNAGRLWVGESPKQAEHARGLVPKLLQLSADEYEREASAS